MGGLGFRGSVVPLQEFENAWAHSVDEVSFAEQGIQTVPPCLMNWVPRQV